jgi:hypothetical protein
MALGFSTYNYNSEIIFGSYGSSFSSCNHPVITNPNDFLGKTVNTELQPEFENSFPLAA